MKTILVTGGAGFIGSNFVLLARAKGYRVVNLDLLTYAGNLGNLTDLVGDPDHLFVKGDIGDEALVRKILDEHRPEALVHFAAESHVDRSIVGPDAFVQTNIVGTFVLLKAALDFWRGQAKDKLPFRFLHVSTDEVFGTLGPLDPAFEETTPYAPNSPYSASKAASDHLVRSYHHTYGLPVVITNCSNNYGPRQFPEKLIPLMILNARDGKPLPVYGDGLNVRDWLYVDDHCRAILVALEKGRPGETYAIGGNCEKKNIEVVRTVCSLMDEMSPQSPQRPHQDLISFVTDRPGHDRRYAINSSKIQRELGWSPEETFESGMKRTVAWYLDHLDWVRAIETREYQAWIDLNYMKR